MLITTPNTPYDTGLKSPVEEKLSTASKGGVFNGGFELGTGSQATDGWIGSIDYGWRIDNSAGTASYDNTISHSGKQSIKLVKNGANAANVSNVDTNNITTTIFKYGIVLKSSTAYRFSMYYKGDGTTAPRTRVVEYDSAYAFTQIGVDILHGTETDWTQYAVTFTTASTTKYILIQPILYLNTVGASGTTSWADDICLEEVVTDTTFTGKVAEKIRPVLQAVTSTDNIDQSLDTGGAYANTYALTNAVNEGATHIQTFTPTKKYTTQIGVWPVAAGTSVNWTLVVHTAANAVVAQVTIAAASVTTGSMMYFNVPNIWTSGALHFHVYASATTGTPTLKANTSDDLETSSFIQRYAKRSETYSVLCNGIKAELSADKDGMLSNSVIDLDNAKYKYINDFTDTTFQRHSNDIYSASAGESNGATQVLNGWSAFATGSGSTSAGQLGGSVTVTTANVNYIFKINTVLPVRHFKVRTEWYSGAAVDKTIQVSPDNVSWTTIETINHTTGWGVFKVSETDVLNGLSSFFVKFNKGTGTDYISMGFISFEADLDTSKVPTNLFYPISTNQFTETVKLPLNATRLYFQLSKYTNEYGVVVPALEFTDGSAVMIGYTPLKLDNSQETNPSILILSTTTNYQASGTGSSSGGYILNSGEYMTFTSTVAEIKVDYQVGLGTTTFSNITKNSYYLSSNGLGNDTTQDPSHQFNAVLGIRNQGILQRVQDIGDEMELVRQGIASTQQLVRNSGLIVGYDAGTTDDYAITLPDFKGYTTGLQVLFKANTANTTGCTLNVNGLGAIAIVKGVSTALSSNDILALMWCYVVYDGTNFVILNPRAL